jgi:hypothetical protein
MSGTGGPFARLPAVNPNTVVCRNRTQTNRLTGNRQLATDIRAIIE